MRIHQSHIHAAIQFRATNLQQNLPDIEELKETLRGLPDAINSCAERHLRTAAQFPSIAILTSRTEATHDTPTPTHRAGR